VPERVVFPGHGVEFFGFRIGGNFPLHFVEIGAGVRKDFAGFLRASFNLAREEIGDPAGNRTRLKCFALLR
jgi:hypothetical protein